MTVLLKATRATVELQTNGKSSLVISLDVNRGPRGEPGAPAEDITAGAGLVRVGNEIRLAIGALPIAG